MATVTAQASTTVLRPCASKSRFLTGSSGKLNRVISFKPTSPSSLSSFKVEAKKGEWLPGLASPGYLNGSLPGDNGFDPLGLAEGPRELEMVHPGRACEQSVGHVGCHRNATAGSVEQCRNNQRSKMVRCRKIRILCIIIDTFRDRVHLVSLRGDQTVARHQEPWKCQPRSYLQEL
ncbi:hypothetical protein HYC85_020597 [Camellia sinensis]|uniref:Chlorophyll a-b binding protein, chloroplastic n=1 Tax=Camellia sinensis TaxID=4442 RepID=A0A7J7GRZ0_CAMSI|nr:hypothetical protein HYC85_020597 [Camellia sinensis]